MGVASVIVRGGCLAVPQEGMALAMPFFFVFFGHKCPQELVIQKGFTCVEGEVMNCFDSVLISILFVLLFFWLYNRNSKVIVKKV